MKRAVILALLCSAVVAEARPGGGHSSSGGGRSSSSSSSSSSRSSSGGSSYSGGGGGSGSMSAEAFVFLLVAIGIIALVKHLAKSKQTEWTSSVPEYKPAVSVAPLAQRDPDFSRAVFEDFAFELYAALHRGRGDPSAFSAYVSPVALGQIRARGTAPHQVVIGTLRIESVNFTTQPTPSELIMVRVEATHFVGTQAVMAVEHWQFVRDAGAKSHPPERTRTWPCPNCGSAWTTGTTRTCAHCGQDVGTGRFAWALLQIWLDSEAPAYASLTGTVAEYGNELLTVVDPPADALMQAITKDDPQVTFAQLQARVSLIYQQLNTAWNANDLKPVRGLVTVQLRNYLEYWLREYARQGLRNELADPHIAATSLAKVTRDKYYDAITVRIFADGCDFTVDAAGNLAGGSKTSRRAYTEYWTLLRSSSRRGPVTTTTNCPNCGAPLSISDAGTCTHCEATVENGSFDWVLSKIEQDDNYTG